MAENETTERFIADVEQFVRELQRAAREADQWSDRTREAGERAREAGHRAAEAAERAQRAQRDAARAAEEYARGEGSAERAAEQAARAQRELERAQIAQARAARAAARAENEQADELERLGREAARAAFEEELARRRAAGETEHHNNLLRRLSETFGDLSREGGRAFQEMEDGAEEASKSFSDLASPQGAGKIVALLTLLPILAQLAGAALTLGIGGGLAALGIMAAAKSEEVKAAFSGMARDVGSRLKEMAKPFEPELVKIANIARRTFDDLAPYIGAAFAKIAPEITEFAEAVSNSLKPFGPMIESATAKFGPLIKVLGDELPVLTGSLAAAFTRMIEATDPDALAMTIEVLAGIVTEISYLMVALERLGSDFATVYGWMVKVSETGFRVWDAMTGGADKTTTAMVDLTSQQQKAADSARAWAAEINNLKAALDELAGKTLSAREANRQFQAAIDEASDAVKKNGRTLDINTAAGRDNQAALDKIAQSALAARKAMDAKGTSDKAAARAADEARNRFIATAVAMGMSRAKAADLADQMGLLRGSVLRVPSSKGVAIKQHGIGDAIAASKSLRSAINSIPNRDVYVTYHLQHTGDSIRRSKDLGYASGTDNAPPGMAWVGERGPELMAFAGGEMVLNHLESMRLAAKARDVFKTLPAPRGTRFSTLPANSGDQFRSMPMPKPTPKPIFKQLPKAPAAATVTYVTHNTYEIRGSVWAEKELLDVVQRQAARRNIRNPGLPQFGGRGL